MGYTVVALKNRIMEMYPEIETNGVMMSLVFNKDNDTYFISFSKGLNAFATHLQRNEVDKCMDGIKFVFLGFQIGRWLQSFVSGQTQTTDSPALQTGRQQEPERGHYRWPDNRKEEPWATQLSH
ncbi:MAG: hypothetical protein HZB31_00375 [Nitrospirae bacterium]|nr:hypothetical protein [Nitrospirota bacterium]